MDTLSFFLLGNKSRHAWRLSTIFLLFLVVIYYYTFLQTANPVIAIAVVLGIVVMTFGYIYYRQQQDKLVYDQDIQRKQMQKQEMLKGLKKNSHNCMSCNTPLEGRFCETCGFDNERAILND
ncbi:MAG: hypothetical protein INQ03_19995 [Candidatus Heimdallarchaeota archaeon]|nr:hypothetical protein [Candidatus Heimdallarchaeota archaeon]